MHRSQLSTKVPKTWSPLPRFSSAFALLLLAVLLSVPVSSRMAAQTTENVSAWGPVVMLGQAASQDAPALWRRGRQVLAVWTGTQDDRVFQLAGGIGADGSTAVESRPLTVRAAFPHSQSLIQATRDVTHLLWLDAESDDQTDGVRLWSALLNVSGEVERGALRLSKERTYHYDVASVDTQLVEAVWSEGLTAEPTLYSRRIDPLGRPRPPRKLATDADWPALVSGPNNRLMLFWIAQDTTVLMADLTDDGLQNPQAAVTIPFLDTGDHLESFNAAVDGTHLYLFWNITRASGTFETFFSSSPIDSGYWTNPQQVTLSVLPNAFFTTGFNGGEAQRVAEGNRHAAWVTPVRGQFDVLPVVAQIGGELGVLYFQDGALAAYQPVAALEAPGLIGMVSFLADRDRHFDLAWAQPSQAGYANFSFTSTR